MAKLAPANQKSYSPINTAIISSVLSAGARPQGGQATELSVAPQRPALLPIKSATARKFDQEKRILFTREESRALDRLVNALAHRLDTPIKASHVMRALTLLLMNAEGDIDRRAMELGSLVRPPNGDMASIQRFERELARLLGQSLRDASPLRD